MAGLDGVLGVTIAFCDNNGIPVPAPSRSPVSTRRGSGGWG